MPNSKFISVRIEDQGIRLDKFVLKYFSNIPFSIIQKKIRLGDFRVNLIKQKPNYKLLHLDKVFYKENMTIINSFNEKSNVPEKIRKILKSSILFEDNKILIFNKPYGISVQGGSKISYSIDDALPFFSSKGNTLKLTHRIDKNTTGILIIAKSKEVAKNITKLFKENRILKTYWAVVIGFAQNKSGYIKSSISKIKLNGLEKVRETKGTDKVALTYYKTLETRSGLSLMEVMPKTGRTHQIRAHLLSKNCPILGDSKYKIETFKNNSFLNEKMHLHAKSISFNLNETTYSIEAELPNHFKNTLKNYKFETKL
ncbi:MAG: RluA family pseudouridine synthase [Pseudomonadota bacterium]|nr:RluA family pseudouridine synthase [Pseudomonadota bacterium]